MSAFLGPIHNWLYGKIKIQKEMTDNIEVILEDKVQGAIANLDAEYGKNSSGSLEEIIDLQNIHGWLQNEIIKSEYRLASAVTELLKKEKECMEALRGIFYHKGVKTGEEISIITMQDAYKALNDTLLDGMPCDHVNAIKEQDEEAITWERTCDIHKQYWDEAGGDITIYHKLREVFIKGLLKNTNLGYFEIDDHTFEIRKIN